MKRSINLETHPEIICADRFLRLIPRLGRIRKAALLSAMYKENSQEYALYRDYFEVALDILHSEKYIEFTEISNDKLADTEYFLTNTGRMLLDTGGYLRRHREKIEKEKFDKIVSTAEGKKKIFDNKVKYIIFFIVILSAIVGLWRQSSTEHEKPGTETQNLPIKDSLAKQALDQSKTESPSTSGKKQPVNQVVRTPENSSPQAPAQPAEKKNNDKSLLTQPIQTAEADNIEFKLVQAVGNSRAQSVTITLILTTSSANWYIMSAVKSIIDAEGNEYRLKSFTNGASDYSRRIDLITAIPIKCTYTFGGVLPDVKGIKLFKYDYTHRAGEPFAVEFRDISIDWK